MGLMGSRLRDAGLLAFLAFFTAHAADWPMYLGDVAHSSYAANETQIHGANVSRLAPIWKLSVGATLSSAVTVSGGVLYFGAWDGNFYAVNAATGTVLWSAFVGVAPSPANNQDGACMPGIGVSSQPVVSGGSVFVGGGDSTVYALDRTTGDVQWTLPLADPQSGAYLWSSVMLSNNALYIGIASLADCPLVRGGLARIPLDDPTHPLIRYLVPEGSVGASVWSTPAIDEQAGLVYVTTGNADRQDATRGEYGSALLALDAVTLEIRASFFLTIPYGDADVDFGSSPLLFQTADGQPYVAANGKNGVVYVLRRPDLSLAWQYQIALDCIDPKLGCGSVSTPAFDGSVLYTGAGTSATPGGTPGQVFAFDPASGQPNWIYSAPGVVIAPVTLTPGLVWVPNTKGLSILDSATGSELWTQNDSGGLFSQAAVSDGTVYCSFITGDVVAFRPREPVPLRSKPSRQM